jgi:hypothetical protein
LAGNIGGILIIGWCPAVTSEASSSAGGILRRFGKFCEDGYTGCIGNVEDDSGLVVIDVAGDLCHAGKDHASLVSDIERVHGGERFVMAETAFPPNAVIRSPFEVGKQAVI